MTRLWLVVGLVGACASASSDNASRPAHEIVSGAGRIHGGGVRMDVAIGHAFVQRPVKSASSIAKSASAVAP